MTAARVVPVVSVLVVEDSLEFQLLIGAALGDGRFEVDFASTGAEAHESLERSEPDVAIVDWNLPDADGRELCAMLRSTTNASVLMVTGRDAEDDILAGFSAGADDYVTKPFSPRQLVARVDAIVARRPTAKQESDTPPAKDSCVAIDESSRRVTVDGQEVDLTRIEFDLFAALLARPSMVFSRSLLLETVWRGESFGNTHVVDVHIGNLRKKIDRAGHRHIETVRGVGYRLAALAAAPAG